MKFIFRLCLPMLMVGILFSTTACGQKGKLIIPNVPPPMLTPYPTAKPASLETQATVASPEAASPTPISAPENTH